MDYIKRLNDSYHSILVDYFFQEYQSRSVVGQGNINQGMNNFTPRSNLKGHGRNLGVTKSPLLNPLQNQLTMRSFLENTETTKIEPTEATFALEGKLC